MGKHDCKKNRVEELLGQSWTVTQICLEADIPLGSIPYLLAKWGLSKKQVRRTGQYSQKTRKAWSKAYTDIHRSGKTSGENHWTYDKLRLKGEWVSPDDVKSILEELVAQDMILAQMAEECRVDPRTITNWLKRFGLQQGIRKGKRCSWYRGGWIKEQGPDWLELREEILERDKYECCRCGMTQEEARKRGHTLSIHHIVPWRETHDNSPDNLVTLCQSCHMKEEWQNGCWRA